MFREAGSEKFFVNVSTESLFLLEIFTALLNYKMLLMSYLATTFHNFSINDNLIIKLYNKKGNYYMYKCYNNKIPNYIPDMRENDNENDNEKYILRSKISKIHKGLCLGYIDTIEIIYRNFKFIYNISCCELKKGYSKIFLNKDFKSVLDSGIFDSLGHDLSIHIINCFEPFIIKFGFITLNVVPRIIPHKEPREPNEKTVSDFDKWIVQYLYVDSTIIYDSDIESNSGSESISDSEYETYDGFDTKIYGPDTYASCKSVFDHLVENQDYYGLFINDHTFKGYSKNGNYLSLAKMIKL
jgi:hypothetical protein